MEEASSELGGIDSLVYCAGVGILRPLAELDAADWRRTFDTNVVGAALVTKAALPHLTASNGTVAYLSSISASFTDPWPGLGAYVVSKAALDKLIEAWRAEHGSVGFTRVVVGNCVGGEGASATSLTAEWDQDLAARFYPAWMAKGYVNSDFLDVDEIVRVIANLLENRAGTSIPSITITARSIAASS
ncbi:SDR family oxidoreductase [Parafrankia colletiae]|uniref:SDR family oxidoreductase n=1 Tax=Parafrankia colletiae TaxID=573497 RepID=UPI001F518B1E